VCHQQPAGTGSATRTHSAFRPADHTPGLTSVKVVPARWGSPSDRLSLTLGKRTVVLAAVIIPDLAWHLARFTASQDDALLFTGPTGVPLWHSSFRHRYWLPALAKAGMTGIHLHDLRHTGNHPAATSGATLRELMDRMGHSSSRAALIYLQMIADAISEQARKHRPHSHAPPTEGPAQEKHRHVTGTVLRDEPQTWEHPARLLRI
jgi:hypothetical protein